MSEALALKYRPRKFTDVTEQGAVIATLQNQINTNSHKNCYLFCGPAGCGKTTNARIFANELNKGQGTPIEIDGARNNGVEQVKLIIDGCKTKPLEGEYKVYIIDEAHMITQAGFNALLKTLEEPPKHAIFIMCTTDAHKVIPTVLSRVQRYDFKRISLDGIISRLILILEKEKESRDITYEKEAIEYIAKMADGGMRDAITTMDKCLSYSSDLTTKNVLEALGASDYVTMCKLLTAIEGKNSKDCITIIEDVYNTGVDLIQFIKQFWLFVLDIAKYGLCKDFKYTQLPVTLENEVKTLSEKLPDNLLHELVELNSKIKREANVKQYVEAFMLYLLQEEL